MTTVDEREEVLHAVAEELTRTAVRDGASGLSQLLGVGEEEAVRQFRAAVQQWADFVEQEHAHLSRIRGWAWA
ncbi:MAG TPA: hypothetical protein VGQ29_06290 [Gemmatimonadales bacterium]|jgi:hypothetical protein|nr:hypothetical protein [Gemmatimonadales bacterium]